MFSLDVLAASLLAVTAAALLLYVFTADARSFAQRAADADLQANAFLASEKAVKTCADDSGGGRAFCENGVVYANVIAPNFFPTTEIPAPVKAPGASRACAQRIVLVDGKQKLAVFCTEGKPKGESDEATE